MVPSAAGVFDVPPDTRFQKHRHEGLHLCAVLRGGFREWQGRDVRTMEPGLLRLSPSTEHDIRFSASGARCLLVEISDEDSRALRRMPRSSAFVTDAWLTVLAGRLEAALVQEPAVERAHDHLLELLAQLSRRETGRLGGPPPRWLLAARDRLADEWRLPPSADALALAAGVHRVHLVRSFRDHFGCTLRGYVRRRRVARAVALIRDARIPLARVAAEAGFSDQAHLTRSLQRAFGVTPLVLRRRLSSRVTCVQESRGALLLA